ncbi:hypothetical protein ET495_09330 [Xylanimonas allomyrinae]|uniref:Uncharacterized protein n=1 Tax=Xylanimonas allomyrinae TaxID=2509459 RepID=A0A4P6ESN6_9MICO|nr:hypothetical protein [Xylanimonas allomyrinae]QAY63417.1 hypothetical protein ET495_09330 [Xylanimonas allomyrinae]
MPPSLEPSREPGAPDTRTDHAAPVPSTRALRVLLSLLVVEAAVLVAAAVVLVVDLLARGGGDGSREMGMGAFLAACALGVAWALWAAARALGSGRRAGRAVAMTWQIFQAVIGASAVASGSGLPMVLGAVLLALALVVAALLLTPRVVEATTRS